MSSSNVMAKHFRLFLYLKIVCRLQGPCVHCYAVHAEIYIGRDGNRMITQMEMSEHDGQKPFFSHIHPKLFNMIFLLQDEYILAG
jgi:hypothetical protein